jgi:hypothetical protein
MARRSYRGREETLRDKLTRRRKAEAAQAAQKSQLPLF